MRGDELVGMISIGDVVRGIISTQAHAIDQLSGYIDAAGPSAGDRASATKGHGVSSKTTPYPPGPAVAVVP
jgi:hypothetical protein